MAILMCSYFKGLLIRRNYNRSLNGLLKVRSIGFGHLSTGFRGADMVTSGLASLWRRRKEADLEKYRKLKAEKRDVYSV